MEFTRTRGANSAATDLVIPRTAHFVENFRPALVGGFHVSHQDGNLRLGDTAHALASLASYMDLIAEDG